MSREPAPATWFPDGVIDARNVTALSIALQSAAREAGFTRETYAAAVAQMAESLIGFDGKDDINGEVLRFVIDRLQATIDAMRGSVN